jgi:hypothetical protein
VSADRSPDSRIIDARSARRGRSRRESAALILLPLVADAIVAIVVALLVARAGGGAIGLGPIDLVPVGPEIPHAGPLMVSDFDALLATAESATGEVYDCQEPWVVASGSIKWACRSSELLVVIEANARGEIYELDATWFGFDDRATDLPAWASATLPAGTLASTSVSWVSSNLGTKAETRIGRAYFSVGGARGALTLRVSG